MAAQVSRRAFMAGAALALAGGALAGLSGCGEEPGLKAALLDTGELVFTDSLGKLWKRAGRSTRAKPTPIPIAPLGMNPRVR